MLNDTFVDKVCTIYDISYVKIGATQVPVKTTLYENIPCDFGKSNVTSSNYTDVQARETDLEVFEIVLNAGYELVRAQMYVDLFEQPDDNTLVEAGTFLIVNTPDFVKDRNGRIDNIYLGCRQIDGSSN